MTSKSGIGIKNPNLVVIQSSRFRWYSFVFKKKQSRLVSFWANSSIYYM